MVEQEGILQRKNGCITRLMGIILILIGIPFVFLLFVIGDDGSCLSFSSDDPIVVSGCLDNCSPQKFRSLYDPNCKVMCPGLIAYGIRYVYNQLGEQKIGLYLKSNLINIGRAIDYHDMIWDNFEEASDEISSINENVIWCKISDTLYYVKEDRRVEKEIISLMVAASGLIIGLVGLRMLMKKNVSNLTDPPSYEELDV